MRAGVVTAADGEGRFDRGLMTPEPRRAAVATDRMTRKMLIWDRSTGNPWEVRVAALGSSGDLVDRMVNASLVPRP